MTIKKIRSSIEIKFIQIIDIEITQIDDPEAILTIDHITIITTIYPVIIPVIEIKFIKTNQEINLSHDIKTLLNIQTGKIETTDVVHGNIKDN